MDDIPPTTLSSRLDPGLAFAAALVAPVLLYAIGLGSLDRLLYPATSIAVGGYLYYKRSPWYVGFCVWLFCATPLVRRLADEQAGWDPSNPILLAPYLSCAFAGISAITFRMRSTAPIAPFVIMLGCVGYGLILAMCNGRVASGAVDAMKWSVGPLFAVHLLAQADERWINHRAAVISFVIAGPAMAVYGVAQYINPPPWDADWMINVASLGLNSIGHPAPFEVRVFSTMNSPGSFGSALATAILIGLHQRRFLIFIPVVMVMVLGMLLSQYRAIWAGTLIGIICLFLSGASTAKLRVLLAAGALILMGASASVMPEISRPIAERLQTLNQLDADASGEDRLHQYERFLGQPHNDLVLGEGLALDGASRRLDHGHTVIIDSGIIVIFSAFGVFSGTVFFFGLFAAIGLTFTSSARSCPETPLYRAIIIATFCQLPFGAVNVGESGFGAWLFLGLTAAAVATARADIGARQFRMKVEASIR
jgi:hypothetical protein